MRGVQITKLKPDGVTLYQDVLALDQSEELYGHFNQEGWENRGNQEVQYYGYRYDLTAMDLKGTTLVSLYIAEEFTKVLDCLANALVKTNILSEKPNQITIVKYDPEDGGELQAVKYPYPMYGKQGAILNLGSDAYMAFSPPAGKDINVKLPVGSIVTFKDIARSHYKQYIRDDLKRGTYMSILFLTNSFPGKEYTKKINKHISRKKRIREETIHPGGPSGGLSGEGPYQRPLSGKRSGTCLTRSNVKLRDDQMAVVNYLEDHRGVIAAYGTGSGKTLIAITAAECYLDKNPDGRVLLIVPTAARDGFKENMKKYGISDKDNKYCFYGYQEFVNNYDWKNDTIKLKGRLDAGICTSCKDVFLIIDEAHELRTPTPWSGITPFVPPKKGQKEKLTGIRPIHAIHCAATAAKVLLLTATPIVNDPYDMANLVAMVRGEAPLLERNFYEIAGVSPRKPEEFIGRKINKKFRDVIGHELEAYKGRSFNDYFCGVIMFYKQEKTKDWPSEKEIWRPIEMNEEYYSKYYKIEKKKLALFRKHARRASGKHKGKKSGLSVVSNPSAFYTIVSQATNSLEGSPKIAETIKYIKNKKPGEKILIYSGFLEAGLDEIKKKLDTRFYIKKEVRLPFDEIDKQFTRRIGNKPTILHAWADIKKRVGKKKGEKLTQKEINDEIHDIIDEKEEELRNKLGQILKQKYKSKGWLVGDEFLNSDYQEQFDSELIEEFEKQVKNLFRGQIEKTINFVYHEKRLLPLETLKQEAKDRRIPSKDIKGNTKQAYYEALRDYVEISGDIPKTKRENDRKRFNDQDSGLDIMLISKAGGMALDLKGVRKVIILESLWNRPGEEQVKGRAIRFESHTDPWLPLSQQNVEVIHLVLTKPGGPIQESESDIHLLSEKEGFDFSSFQRPLERLSTTDEKGKEDKDTSYSADVAKLLLTFHKDAINKVFEAELKKC